MVDAFLAMRPVSDLLYLAKRAQVAVVGGGAAQEMTGRLETIAATQESLSAAEGLADCERGLRSLYKTLDRNRI